MAWSYDRFIERRQSGGGKWYARLVFLDDNGAEQLIGFKFDSSPSDAQITAIATQFLQNKNATRQWSAKLIATNGQDTRTIYIPLAEGITPVRLRNLLNTLSDALQTEAAANG